MHIVLLHNPTAGDQEFSEEKLVRLLKQHKHKVKYSAVKEGLADRKLLKWADLVVAAGGDGTIRKTLTEMADWKIPVGILPLGTANNIARSLGIGTEIAALVAGWDQGKSRKIDLGVAKGPWGRVRFVEGIGVGLVSRTMSILNDFDARVVHPFASTGDKLHRDIAVLTALAYEMPPIKARVKTERTKVKDEYLMLEILNISRAGPGLLLADEAKPDDGLLNIVSMIGGERKQLIRELESQVARQGAAHLHDRTARKVRLELSPCELRIDDQIRLVPADFRKLPGRRARIDVSLERGAVSVFC